MAVFMRGKTECSICNKVIIESDAIVGTSHFISDQSDPLWRFSDSVMHKICFLNWPERGNFISKFNKEYSQVFFKNGVYHHMNDDGTIVSMKKESGN